MRRLIVTLSETNSPLLSKHKNQSQTINDALDLYLSDITTGKIDSMKTSFKVIAQKLTEIEAKIDYMANKVVK